MSDAPRPVRRRRRRIVAGAAALVAAAAVGAVGQSGSTYAAFSDFGVITDNVAGAGVWGTDLPLLPQECTDTGFVPTNWFVITDEGAFYSDGVASLEPAGPPKPGSTTAGAFHGTPESDFIVNQGGKRTLHGWAGDDCIVAGVDGDILHGGAGNDVLIGGKKQKKGEFLFEAATLAPPSPPAAMVEEPVAVAVAEDPALEEPAVEEPVVEEPPPSLAELGYLDGEEGADVCYPGPEDLMENCETSAGVAP